MLRFGGHTFNKGFIGIILYCLLAYILSYMSEQSIGLPQLIGVFFYIGGAILEVLDQRGWHFTIIENSILESENLNTYDKLTYIILARFANKNAKTCYPSLNLLCKYVGCSRPTVIKSLKKLEELKLIEIQNRDTEKEGHISNIYVLLDVDNPVNNL